MPFLCSALGRSSYDKVPQVLCSRSPHRHIKHTTHDGITIPSQSSHFHKGPNPSRQSHTLHLHLHPLRQLLNGHTAPRRLRVPKMQFVFPIHFRKILHIRQEHRHLHHLAQVTAGLFEDLVDVFDAEGGFVGDCSGWQGAVC